MLTVHLSCPLALLPFCPRVHILSPLLTLEVVHCCVWISCFVLFFSGDIALPPPKHPQPVPVRAQQCGPLLAIVAHPIMSWALFGSEEAGKIIEEPFGMTREYGPNARQVPFRVYGVYGLC